MSIDALIARLAPSQRADIANELLALGQEHERDCPDCDEGIIYTRGASGPTTQFLEALTDALKGT